MLDVSSCVTATITVTTARLLVPDTAAAAADCLLAPHVTRPRDKGVVLLCILVTTSQPSNVYVVMTTFLVS